METKNETEEKNNNGVVGSIGQKKESHVVKAIDYKLEEIRELKELMEKSEKLNEFYASIFKLEGLGKDVVNHRFKTAKLFSPKSDEIKDLEKLEKLLVTFKADYSKLANDISETLEKYNSNNKKALSIFKLKNEQLINKIEMLNSK